MSGPDLLRTPLLSVERQGQEGKGKGLDSTIIGLAASRNALLRRLPEEVADFVFMFAYRPQTTIKACSARLSQCSKRDTTPVRLWRQITGKEQIQRAVLYEQSVLCALLYFLRSVNSVEAVDLVVPIFRKVWGDVPLTSFCSLLSLDIGSVARLWEQHPPYPRSCMNALIGYLYAVDMKSHATMTTDERALVHNLVAVWPNSIDSTIRSLAVFPLFRSPEFSIPSYLSGKNIVNANSQFMIISLKNVNYGSQEKLISFRN